MYRILSNVLLVVGAALFLLAFFDRSDGFLVAGAILLGAVLIAASISQSRPPNES